MTRRSASRPPASDLEKPHEVHQYGDRARSPPHCSSRVRSLGHPGTAGPAAGIPVHAVLDDGGDGRLFALRTADDPQSDLAEI